ncbi:MAG: hypothetical protein E6R08_00750 [Nevskiaceae bacterium]|nr:MAG: hypothetical protein E6R08_00750 [Nevskiaceae bacterium]
MATGIRAQLEDLDKLSLDDDDSQEAQQGGTAARPAASRPSTAPGQLAQFSQHQQMLLDEVQKLQKSAGDAIELAVDEVVESPYQTRAIDAEQLKQLIDNLRVNELSTPISVRRRRDGKFELITGHHRIEAYKALKAEGGPGADRFAKIRASIVAMTDEQAAQAVFFDNLLAPNLSDFERYLGFAALKRVGGVEKTQKELSERSGFSEAQISRLFSFEKLPPECLPVLREHRKCLGATAASKLVDLPAEAAAKLPEGLRLVAQGELQQAQLARWALGDLQGTTKTTNPSTAFKRGRTTFATVARQGDKLIFTFKLESDVKAFEQFAKERLEQMKESAD